VISAARVVAQNVAYEIPMFLIAIALVMVTHTFDSGKRFSCNRGILELEPFQFWGQPSHACGVPDVFSLLAG